MPDLHTSVLMRWITSLQANVKSLMTKRNGSETASRKGPALASAGSRYEPCSILTTNGIPNVVWFEDAFAFYGSGTCVAELYVLVKDPESAAEFLLQTGYERTMPRHIFEYDEIECRGGIHLKYPNNDNERSVVLISATTWHYDMDLKVEGSIVPLPSLNELLNSLMAYWLQMSESERYEKQVFAMSLVCLIDLGYNLSAPNYAIVNSIDFAQQLRPEFREIHFDLIGNYPKQSGIASFGKHEYHKLRCQEIKDGKFTPKPYPSDSFPPSLAEYPGLTGLHFDIPPSKRKLRKRPPKTVLTSIDEAMDAQESL